MHHHFSAPISSTAPFLRAPNLQSLLEHSSLPRCSLLRLAVPRRVFTMSHFEYATDRLKWLHEHRKLIGGLEFYEEPPILRFFGGRVKPKNNWGARLAEAFEKDFGP